MTKLTKIENVENRFYEVSFAWSTKKRNILLDLVIVQKTSKQDEFRQIFKI